MSPVALTFIATLGLIHIFAGRLGWIDTLPQRRWLSFGAGVSLAYVFVDVLPILSAGQSSLQDASGVIFEALTHHVYLIALIGLATFYALELLAKRSRADSRVDHTSPGVFWVHTVSFALYNALLGYLLREAEHHGLLACLLLFIALALHFTVNDYALRGHHKSLYDHYGRWLLAAAVVSGYLVGTLYMVDVKTIAILWAFVAGGLILNVIKDELPEQRDTSLSAFFVGMVYWYIYGERRYVVASK
jgi:hypothetical protein